jgi:D-amino-acid dehydrogenase
MTDAALEEPVVVVGAGIVGLSAALSVQRAGRSVVVVDRGAPGHGASYGHAGGIAVTWVSPQGLPKITRRLPRWLLDPLGPVAVRWPYLPRLIPWFVRLRSHSSPTEVRRLGDALASLMAEAWPSWDRLLGDLDGGVRATIRHDGSLSVYREPRRLERDAAMWDMRRERGFRVEVTEDPGAWEPALSREFSVGVHEPEAKWCEDPMAVIDAMASRLQKAGGRLVRGEAEDFEVEDGAVRAVRVDGEPVRAGAVVLAAGAWSHRLAARLGHRIPLESERGYHVDVPEPGVRPVRILSLAEHKVVVTPLRTGVRISGTAEFGGVDSSPDFRRADAIVTVARNALPGLRVGDSSRWAGDRPMLPDSLPVIGRDPGCRNVYHAFGHSHIGFTLGPVTGDLVADLVTGRPARVDLSPFRVDRFG